MKSEKCKFGRAIIATTLILAVLALAFVGTASAKTWYVDDDGGQDFTRIQAAVVAASDGDTIYVYEGYYNEIVTLDKELTVIGANKTTTIIDGNNIKDVVKITADNCFLSGFTVKNSGGSYAGVKIYEGKNANVSGNIIAGHVCGIIINASSALIVNNTIRSDLGSPIGIWIKTSNWNTIVGNYIHVTTTTSCGGYNIYIESSNHNEIVDNYLFGDKYCSGDYPIYLKSSQYNTITNNKIYSLCSGIYLGWVSNYNNINGNNIVSTWWNGIELRSSHQNTISNNDVSNCNKNGINLDFSNDNNIVGNIASSNNLNGIYLCHSDRNMISGNDVFENNKYGIHLDSTDNNDNTITNNNIASNKEDGIFIRSSDNTISGNTIVRNKGDGIDLASINNIEIANNEIASNTWYGIKMNAVTDSRIFENNISDNFYGVGLDACSNNKIWHNNFLANIDNAYDDASTNKWYKGPVSGGNYWSDHVCHGNPSNGSEPYEIDADSVDHYPFENVSGWVLTMPAVSITTDKTDYSPGNTMNITLGFYNPASSPVNTYFVWYLRLPDYGYEKPVMSTPLTLPADFEFLYNVSIPIGDWGAYGFNATWYVALMETTPPYETISEDSANWSYVPAGKGIGEVKPAEIGGEIKTKLNEEVALTLTK